MLFGVSDLLLFISIIIHMPLYALHESAGPPRQYDVLRHSGPRDGPGEGAHGARPRDVQPLSGRRVGAPPHPAPA